MNLRQAAKLIVLLLLSPVAVAGINIDGDKITFADGTTQSTAAGTGYKDIVVVSAGGTATENGSALQNAMSSITDSSSSNPYLIKLEPGIYDLGTTTLDCKPYVDIEGSGQGITRIVAAVDSGGRATLQASTGDVCEIRLLAVVSSHSGANSRAIRAEFGAELSLVQVTAELASKADAGIGILSVTGAKTTMRDCSVVMSDTCMDSVGVDVEDEGSVVVIRNSDISTIAFTTGTAVQVTKGGSVNLGNCALLGYGGVTSYGVLVEAGGGSVLARGSLIETLETYGGLNSSAAVRTNDASAVAEFEHCSIFGNATPGNNVAVSVGAGAVHVAYCEVKGEESHYSVADGAELLRLWCHNDGIPQSNI